MDHVLSALTSTGLRSPLQTSYPESATGGSLGEDSLLDRYKSHAEKYSRAVIDNGGATMPSTSHDIASGADPLPVGDKEWYGVGGAKDYRQEGRPRVPEKILQPSQFTDTEALRHILGVEDHNTARERTGTQVEAAFAGGWKENGPDGNPRIVLDHSLALPGKDTALNMGREAGERAIFDAKNIQDISTETGKPI